MARQQWRLRVTGKQRQEVDVNLLVAAVIAFGEQLHAEEREREQSVADGRTTSPYRPEEEA
jgi:hypothetical protein